MENNIQQQNNNIINIIQDNNINIIQEQDNNLNNNINIIQDNNNINIIQDNNNINIIQDNNNFNNNLNINQEQVDYSYLYNYMFNIKQAFDESNLSEYFIINELSTILYQNNIININQTLINFYEYYNLQVPNCLLNNYESNDSIEPVHNIINIMEILIININSNQTDVITSLDNNEITKLNTYDLEEDLTYNCAICMDNMKKTEKVIKLKCNHTFHYNCITQYLQEYNYKCPICRIELGPTKNDI